MFDRLGIEHTTVEHPPFFTVAEGRPCHNKIPGLHGKNLFIEDRIGVIFVEQIWNDDYRPGEQPQLR